MKKTISTITFTALTGLMLASCSSGGSTDQPADDKQINIVASTAIWGDIAETITKNMENVKVTTILNNNRDDPHTYEASAKDLANLTSADIVVANGAGYDNWLTDHVKEGTPLVTAKPLAQGHHHDHEHGHGDGHNHEQSHEGHDHGGFNPHVWFTMSVVDNFVTMLDAELKKLDPNAKPDTEAVTKQTAKFSERFSKLKDTRVVLTEPVAEGILDQSEMRDATPDGFADSISREAEPSAADIAETQKLINDGKVDVLITNEQSHSAAANNLIKAAKDKNVPIVNINETPGDGQDYFGYVDEVISKLEKI